MIPYKDGRTIPVEDFSPGLRTTGTYFSRINTSPRVMNFRSGRDRLLRKRPGFDMQIQGLTSSPVTGLYEFGLAENNRRLLAHVSSNIYKMDNFDGNWDLLQQDISANYTSEFDTFTSPSGNVMLHCTHNNDPLRSWEGSGVMEPISSGGLISPKYIKVWNNHVWAAGFVGSPSRLRYSNVATYDEWQTDGVDNFDDNFQTGDGDFITGLGVLRGSLYVFKRFSIFRVTYLGGTPLINVLKVIDGKGCIASKSICQAQVYLTGDDGVSRLREALVFLTADREIVAFDGTTIYPLSDQISQDNMYSEVSMQTLNDAALSNAHGIYYAPDSTYLLFVPNGQSSTNNFVIEINMQTRGIFVWDNMDFRCSTILVTESNKQIPYVGSYQGEFYRLMYGSKDKSATMVTGIKSLLHFEQERFSTEITDNMGNIWTAQNGANIDNFRSRFGNTSLYLGGTDEYISTPDGSNWDFSGGIFTIDMFIYPEVLTTNRVLVSQVTDANNYMELALLSTGELKFLTVSGGATVIEIDTSSAGVTTGAWFEIELVENGNNFYIFVNGVLKGSGTDTSRTANYTGTFEIGRANLASPRYFQGWIDEVRILNGSAAHTSGYTAAPATGVYYFDSRTYSDVNITAYYEFDLIDLKVPNVLKKGRYMVVYLKPRSNTTITISRVSSYETSYRESRSYVTNVNSYPLGTTGGMVLGSGSLGADYGGLLCYDVPETAGFVRFKIAEASQLESFVIHRIDFVEDVQGLGHSLLHGVTVS